MNPPVPSFESLTAVPAFLEKNGIVSSNLSIAPPAQVKRAKRVPAWDLPSSAKLQDTTETTHAASPGKAVFQDDGHQYLPEWHHLRGDSQHPLKPYEAPSRSRTICRAGSSRAPGKNLATKKVFCRSDHQF